jgi:hypothetical protein
LKYCRHLADSLFSRFSRCFYASLSCGTTHRSLPNRNKRTALKNDPKRQRAIGELIVRKSLPGVNFPHNFVSDS